MVSMQRPRYAPMGSGVCRLLIFPKALLSSMCLAGQAIRIGKRGWPWDGFA